MIKANKYFIKASNQIFCVNAPPLDLTICDHDAISNQKKRPKRIYPIGLTASAIIFTAWFVAEL
ncbi:TPA: hypothetical protein ACYQCZ_000082 [Streptococcus pneumoniae]